MSDLATLPRDKVAGLFAGVDKFDDALPDETRQALQPILAMSIDPQKQRQRIANQIFLAQRYNKPIDDVVKNYDLCRGQYGEKAFQTPDIDDGGFYAKAGAQMQGEKDQETKVGEMTHKLYDHFISGGTPQDFDTKPYTLDPQYNDFVTAARGHHWNELGKMAQLEHDHIEAVSSAFKAVASRGRGEEGYQQEAGGVEAAINALMQVPAERRGFVLSLAARGIKKEEEGVGEKIAGRMTRGVDSFLTSSGRFFKDRLLKMPGDTSDDERRAVEKMVYGTIAGTIDPMSADNWLGKAALNITEGLPRMAAMFSGPGLALTFAASQQELKESYVQKGIPQDKADGMATFGATVQTAVAGLSGNLVRGRIPGLEKWIGGLSKWQKVGVIGGTEATALATGGAITGTTEDLVQNFRATFNESMPKVAKDEIWEHLKASTISSEALIQTTLMTLVGSGSASFKHEAYGKEILKDRTLLEAAGYNDSTIESVQAAPSIKEAEQALQAGFGKRELGSETQKEAIASLSEPASFVGMQEGIPGKILDFPLFNLNRDIEGHPEGSTVGQGTLERAGFTVAKNSDGSWTVQDVQTGRVIAETSTPEMAAKVKEDATAHQHEQEVAAVAQSIMGDTNLYAVPQGVAKMMQVIDAIRDKQGPIIRAIKGEVFPHTSELSCKAANQLARLASVEQIGPASVDANTYAVMGENIKDAQFNHDLAAVMVQDRLYAKRDAFIQQGDMEAAKAIKDVMSAKEFKKLLANPEIQKAIAAHKAIVQPHSEAMHTESGGKLDVAGKYTGAFINTVAAGEADLPASNGGRMGDLSRQLKKSTAFGKKFTGAAEEYVLDYKQLLNRMLTKNLADYEWRQTIKTLESEGLAVATKAGEKPVRQINGKDTVGMLIQRQPQGASETLYVREDVAKELQAARGLRTNADQNIVGRVLTNIQLLGVGPLNFDSIYHVSNMVSVLSGTERGQTMLKELGSKLPGVNIASALAMVREKAKLVLANDPSIYNDVLKLAESGAWRSHDGGNLGKWFWNSKAAIELLDKSGRLVAKDMFDQGVKNGLFKGGDENLRQFVNQMGQYNSKMMGTAELFFKRWGASPFIVAGRTMNRNAIRRLVGAPSAKPASKEAAAKIWAANIAGTIATLSIPAVINFAATGQVQPKGVPVGGIYTGQNDDGTISYIDPAQWIGLRRGLRISGINSMIDGTEHERGTNKTLRAAASDIIMGYAHPFIGPAANFAFTAGTGATPYEATKGIRPKGGYGASDESLKAAAKDLNPILAKRFEAHEKGENPAVGVVKAIGGAVGVKETRAETDETRTYDMANKWKREHGKDKQDMQYPESQYKKLKDALRHGKDEDVKKELEKLMEGEPKNKVLEGVYLSLSRPFTGSHRGDIEMLKSASEEDKKAVLNAHAHRKELFARLKGIANQVKPNQK